MLLVVLLEEEVAVVMLSKLGVVAPVEEVACCCAGLDTLSTVSWSLCMTRRLPPTPPLALDCCCLPSLLYGMITTCAQDTAMGKAAPDASY